MIKVLLALLCSICLLACKEKQSIEWVMTTPDASWQMVEDVEVAGDNSAMIDVEIDADHPLQVIDGFGSCFNECGWLSLDLLSSADKDEIFKELFQPGYGANFTICRMPVAANDFATDWYSYNENEGDFAMEKFSIERDKKGLIPFIHEALKYNKELKLWASPWSPPSWMKYNKHYACNLSCDGVDDKYYNGLLPEQQGMEGTNMFIQEDSYLEAYALYFAKFIQAYREQKINISMVMPQNEFNSCQVFPSCTWTAEGLNRFVGGFLGPKMKEIGVGLMFGTVERANTLLVDTLLKDPKSSQYIQGVGFQWAGKHAIGKIHQENPSLTIYQTEQECGDGRNDWKTCLYSWSLMKHYLSNGANVYTYWNTSLEKDYISRWGWKQNSLISVDPETKTYKYNYEYYLMKHASHYVLPGAHLLSVSGAFDDILAFRNSDGGLVLILCNKEETVKNLNLKIGDKVLSLSLQANSINTIQIKK